MQEYISSLQNNRVKNIVKLQKSSERKSQKLFVIEGKREIQLAIHSGWELQSFFICEDFGNDMPELPANVPVFSVTKDVFQKIAYRENSDGMLALANFKTFQLSDLKLSDNPFVIVLESVEKPGNLGAILRTADAAQVDAVIVCDPQTDLFNPNVIRSSIGCVFTTQVVACSSDEARNWMLTKHIRIYAAALTATAHYHTVDFKYASAIVMGTESDGLSDFWLQNSDSEIKIPMRGKIDSMNVSTSCAVLVFEAMRQRGF